MARIEWNDIEQNETLDNAAMSEAQGGFGFSRHLFYGSFYGRSFGAAASFTQPTTSAFSLGMPTSRLNAFHVANTPHHNVTSLLRK